MSLSSYITKNRTREIAIRKVHGASVGNVVLMLYREILILVLVASLITSPLSYYLTSRLIDSFAYKARFSPGIFLLAIAGAVITALITVSYHSIMASVANPAGSLKYE